MGSQVVETKEIGIDTGIGVGIYHNTEFVDGKIQLKKVSKTDTGKPVYEMNGYWESEVIDLVDKFKEYDRIALSKLQEITDVYSIMTRTSSDGITFDEYIATTPEGKIQSETKRYIQVKVNLFAGLSNESDLVSDFTSPSAIEDWENNKFIETDGVLKLKKEYQLEMNKDNTWADEGSLHRKLIKKENWKKIDSIGVE